MWKYLYLHIFHYTAVNKTFMIYIYIAFICMLIKKGRYHLGVIFN